MLRKAIPKVIDRTILTRCPGAESGFIAEAYEGAGAVIPLEAIEAELPLADLYERIEFDEGGQG